MPKLLQIIRRVLPGGRIAPNTDAVNRKLRLLTARIERLEADVLKAQRRADSAWSAVTRAQSGFNERMDDLNPVPPAQINGPPKAGQSMKAMLGDYNRNITGGDR